MVKALFKRLRCRFGGSLLSVLHYSAYDYTISYLLYKMVRPALLALLLQFHQRLCAFHAQRWRGFA